MCISVHLHVASFITFFASTINGIALTSTSSLSRIKRYCDSGSPCWTVLCINRHDVTGTEQATASLDVRGNGATSTQLLAVASTRNLSSAINNLQWPHRAKKARMECTNSLTWGPKTTWANGKPFRTFFGILRIKKFLAERRKVGVSALIID